MDIGKEMLEKAVSFLEQRYGKSKAGGVAVLRTEDGQYLISVWPECNNSSADLCAEADKKIMNHMRYFHHVEYAKKDFFILEVI